MSEKHVVIIGAGQAGGQAAASLRQKKYDGRITLIGDESYPPYERPPLSKKVLLGALPLEKTFLRSENYYVENDIALRLNTRVDSFDPQSKTVMLDSGEALQYSDLIIATGSRLRKLSLPGSDLKGIEYLHDIEESKAIGAYLKPDAKIVVIGAGYIGLEVAAVAAQHGADVTVIELQDRVMARAVAPAISAFYEQYHNARGVKMMLNTGVQSFQGEDGHVTAVMTDKGEAITADAIVVGIGVMANDALAQAAGLDCENGIIVDEYTRTSADHVYAIGDVTNHPNDIVGKRLRLESVQNAMSQGRTVAQAIIGEAKPYQEVPWFWSDQYDLKLQIAGINNPNCDIIMRDFNDGKSIAAFYLDGTRLIAVEAVNAMKEYTIGRRLIGQDHKIDLVKLADPDISMKDVDIKADAA